MVEAGGGVDVALELAHNIEGKEGENICLMSVRLEELVDGVVLEDEFSLDSMSGNVDGSSSGVECRRIDLGEAFVDVGC